jgi:hypothetical protein
MAITQPVASESAMRFCRRWIGRSSAFPRVHAGGGLTYTVRDVTSCAGFPSSSSTKRAGPSSKSLLSRMRDDGQVTGEIVSDRRPNKPQQPTRRRRRAAERPRR